MEFKVFELASEEERQAIYNLRIDVFAREQGFPEEVEIDHYDPVAIHYVLKARSKTSEQPEDWKIAGTIRLVVIEMPWTYDETSTLSKDLPNQVGKLGRLAVLPQYRGFGCGRLLVEKLEEGARKVGCVGIVLHSQMPKQGFYAKHGYAPHGEPFDEDGAPHLLMVKKL